MGISDGGGKNFCLTLSTGAVVDMEARTVQEAFKMVDNLLDKIILEHSEEIIKSQISNGKCNAIEIVETEVRYLVENQMSENPKEILCWLLKVLALKKLIQITHPYLISES